MKSILLIEDDSGMSDLLKILFDIEGIECFLPADFSFDTIQLLITNNKPDVILMDVNLKQNNGLTLLKSLKESNNLHENIKIIMTSGSDLKDKCLEAGADKFLLKPYMPDELLKMVKD